jgi:hypothetical protein
MPSKYAEKLESKINQSGLQVAQAVMDAILTDVQANGKERGWDAAREQWAAAGNLQVKDIKIMVGGYEFPMAEVLQTVEDHYVRAFDSHVAATVKEVVLESSLGKTIDVLRDIAGRFEDLKDELNGDIGRKVQEILGPGSYWSESSGTC